MRQQTLCIVTGTTGSASLRECLRSVAAMDDDPRLNVQHWIVIDGPEYRDTVLAILEREARAHCTVVQLPFNTGRDGGTYLCHRIIAMTSYMIPHDSWLSVLDEDNIVLLGHTRAIADAMEHVPEARWGYTMRTVTDGHRTIPDTIESMGLIRPTVMGPPDRLVDTNCYVVRASLARELAPIWGTSPARTPGYMEADRHVIRTLAKHEPTAWCTRKYTVSYTVGNRADSVSMDFFTRSQVSPWDPDLRDIYVFHFDRNKTAVALDPGHPDHHPMAEWCPTMLDDLRGSYNLLNGFECIDSGLPHDATCLMTMCHPSTLPIEHLRSLKTSTHPDMCRILYTAEGPNKRHQAQWTVAFLQEAADVVLTYVRHVLDASAVQTVHAPHNARFISESTVDLVCRDNDGPGTGSIAMVLEPRQGTETYTIDGHTYQCLDGYRIDAANGIGPRLTVVGHGWTQTVARFSEDARPTVAYDLPRFEDTKTSVDTYVHHDCVLILENTDAFGYVSEKIGDALMAGCIPLYDGRSIDTSPDAPEQHRLLTEGRGQWWLDIHELPQTGTLGERIRALVEGLSMDTIRDMKARVRDIRRAYLLTSGTKAMASAIRNIL